MAQWNPATKVLAVLLACLAFIGPLASFAHLALVQHLACEHGEFVDVGRRDVRLAGDAERRSSTTLEPSGTDPHGHSHCLLVPTSRSVLAVHRQRGLATSLIQAQLGYQLTSVFAPPIAVLMLAPKNSPPLA